MKKVGVFGGTFAPPHNGHVYAARAFLKAESLDKLFIIPTYLPPHKELRGDATPEERLEMCRLAFDFDARIEVSDREILRGGKSYTSDTLNELYSADSELLFLCGTDMFLTMDSWHCPDVIFRLATIVCIRREEDMTFLTKIKEKADFYREKYSADVHLLDVPPYPASSTDCRREIHDGLSADIPEKVKEYMEKCRLFRN